MEHTPKVVRKVTRRDALPPIETKQYDEEMAKMRATLVTKTEVKRSTLPKAGRGLFAQEDIKQTQAIVEYKGELLSFDEARVRRLAGKSSHIRSLIPMVYCIDGVKSETGGAMANDPKDFKRYNAEMVSFHSTMNVFRRNPLHSLVYLRALRDIQAGEEIFVNYGLDYEWLIE